MRAGDIALAAKPEELALYGIDIFAAAYRRCKNFVQRISQTQAGRELVNGHILITVGNPVVCDAGCFKLAAKICAYLAAALSVFNPIAADLLVRAGKGKAAVRHGVAEIGGVKVKTDALFTGVIHPRGKMLRAYLVTADSLSK